MTSIETKFTVIKIYQISLQKAQKIDIMFQEEQQIKSPIKHYILTKKNLHSLFINFLIKMFLRFFDFYRLIFLPK